MQPTVASPHAPRAALAPSADVTTIGADLRATAIGAGVGLVVVAVVLGPLMSRGWLQLLDWPTGPRWPEVPAQWSLSSGPLFAIVTTVCRALGGAAVGWLVPAIALVVAATGAARVVPMRPPAALVCALAFVWNPFVLSRLYAGHVAFLLGYALLPWLARVAWHDRLRRPVVAGVLWALACATSVHFVWIGGLLVAAAIPSAVRARGARTACAAFAVCTAVALVPTALWVATDDSAEEPGDERVLDTFASRADDDLGLTLGLMAQQGFWRPSPADAPRALDAWFAPLAGAVIAVAAAGLVGCERHHRRTAATAVLSGVIALVLAHGTAGPFGDAYRIAWRSLPGFAVMREPQKFVALISLLAALGTGLAVSTIASKATRVTAWATAIVVSGVVVAYTPTLAGGLGGHVEVSRFPESIDVVRTRIEAEDPRSVIVVPWTLYSSTVPSGGRVIAAPGRALFGEDVTWSEDPDVAGLADDDDRHRAIGDVLTRADASTIADGLRELGVRWVIEIIDPM
ncbi:MAG TPA: hypothetical protein VF183_02330, partial [Acidimicrobiales bacterium]